MEDFPHLLSPPSPTPPPRIFNADKGEYLSSYGV